MTEAQIALLLKVAEYVERMLMSEVGQVSGARERLIDFMAHVSKVQDEQS